MLDRAEWLLRGLSREARLLEIGPSHRPIAPRSAGWNTTIVDHTTREGLAEKYGYDADTYSRIEEVDHVLEGSAPLHAQLQVDLHGAFDAVISSHVLEHLPDPIGFFGSCAVLLRSGGTLRMAIPDKRRCFDFFRSFTTSGELLEAHARNDAVHSSRTAFDAVAYAIATSQGGAWDRTDYSGVRFIHSLSQAYRCFQRSEITSEYYDFHAWRFSPSSFSLLVLELSHIDAIAFQVKEVSPTRGGEILVDLSHGVERLAEDVLDRERLSLLEQMLTDIGEQVEAVRDRGRPVAGAEGIAA